MKGNITHGTGFLGALLYVFDQKDMPAPVRNYVIDVPGISQKPSLLSRLLSRIEPAHVYFEHRIAGQSDPVQARPLSQNRVRRLSERRLVLNHRGADQPERVLPAVPFGDRMGPGGVRREASAGADRDAGHNARGNPRQPGLNEHVERRPDGGAGSRAAAGDASQASREVRPSDAGRLGLDARVDKNPTRVGGNMHGVDPRQLSKDFAAIRRLRPDIGKPVFHMSLGLPPGERLSDERWDEVSKDMMREMGFDLDKHQYVVVRHEDTDHDHIHIVANRIGSDGSVWLGRFEIYKMIEATQAMEKKHGLTLTPGLGEERAAVKKLTRGEINMAVRTGEEPVRQMLQRLCDEAMQGGPTVVEFAERLEEEGVHVVANLASTGKMNGFSFKVGKSQFSGSQLGTKYKWESLLKAGVTYEQARDGEELSRFKKREPDGPGRADQVAAVEPGLAAAVDLATARALESDPRQPAASDRSANAADEVAPGLIAGGNRDAIAADAIDPGRSAAGDRPADRGDGRAVAEPAGPGEASTGGIRPGDGSPEIDDSRARVGNGARSHAVDREEGSSAGLATDGNDDVSASAWLDLQQRQRDRIAAEASAERVERNEHEAVDDAAGVTERGRPSGAGNDESIERELGRGQGSGRELEGGAGALVEIAGDAIRGSGPSGPAGPDWNRRFKVASARRSSGDPRSSEIVAGTAGGERSVGESVLGERKPARARVSERDRVAAREVDPTAYLQSQGFTCQRGKSTIYVRDSRGDEVYRVTEKDGRFVACDKYENGIGDNIALVQDVEPGLPFADAVYRLYGSPGVAVERPVAPKAAKPKALLVMPPQTPNDEARGQKYLQGRGIDLVTIREAEQVGFLAYGDKAVFSVGRDFGGNPKSATRRATDPADKLQKSDWSGTDKSILPVLPGTSGEVLIVDGGVDALAAHARARRLQQPAPTVLVTGGVGNRSWLNVPALQSELRSATKITISVDNERTDEIQARTNHHVKELQAWIAKIAPVQTVLDSVPVEIGKDIADLNLYEVREHQRKLRADAERADAERIEDEDRAAKIAAERKRRVAELDAGLQQSGPRFTVSNRSKQAIKAAGGNPEKVDWAAVEKQIIDEALRIHNHDSEKTQAAIAKYSPSRADSVVPARLDPSAETARAKRDEQFLANVAAGEKAQREQQAIEAKQAQGQTLSGPSL